MMEELFNTMYKVMRKNQQFADTHTYGYEVAKAQGKAEIAKYVADILNAMMDGTDNNTLMNMMDNLIDRA